MSQMIRKSPTGTEYIVFGDAQRKYELLMSFDKEEDFKRHFELRAYNSPNDTFAEFDSYMSKDYSSKHAFEKGLLQSQVEIAKEAKRVAKGSPYWNGMQHLYGQVKDAIMSDFSTKAGNGVVFGDEKRTYEFLQWPVNGSSRYDFELRTENDPNMPWIEFSADMPEDASSAEVLEAGIARAARKADVFAGKCAADYPDETSLIKQAEHMRQHITDLAESLQDISQSSVVRQKERTAGTRPSEQLMMEADNMDGNAPDQSGPAWD